MTSEDLLAAGWEQVTRVYEYPAYGDYLWRRPEVRDGHLHEFEEAVRAEEIRLKRDGGA